MNYSPEQEPTTTRREFLKRAVVATVVAIGVPTGCSPNDNDPLSTDGEVFGPKAPQLDEQVLATDRLENTLDKTPEELIARTDEQIEVSDRLVGYINSAILESTYFLGLPERVQRRILEPLSMYEFNRYNNLERNGHRASMKPGVNPDGSEDVEVTLADSRHFMHRVDPRIAPPVYASYSADTRSITMPYEISELDKGSLFTGLTVLHEVTHAFQIEEWFQSTLSTPEGSTERIAHAGYLQSNRAIIDYEVDAHIRTLNMFNVLTGGKIMSDAKAQRINLEPYLMIPGVDTALMEYLFNIALQCTTDEGYFLPTTGLLNTIKTNTINAFGEERQADLQDFIGAPDFLNL
jgi:hypothetical protein